MKYQKLFAGLLAAAMTLALTACGSKEPEEETPAAEGIAGGGTDVPQRRSGIKKETTRRRLFSYINPGSAGSR